MDTEQYPSNSHISRNKPPEEPKKVEKVIKGSVVTRKKTLSRRFVDIFFGDDVDSVSSYIMYEVLVPAVKDTLFDMIRGGTEMILFGESKGAARPRRSGGGGNRSYVHYDRVSYRDERRREASPRNRSRHNFDEIVLESRTEAEDVRNNLVDLIEEYSIATVADLYDMVGIDRNYTDEKWGWDNLASSRVERVKGGWLVNLPRPILLD